MTSLLLLIHRGSYDPLYTAFKDTTKLLMWKDCARKVTETKANSKLRALKTSCNSTYNLAVFCTYICDSCTKIVFRAHCTTIKADGFTFGAWGFVIIRKASLLIYLQHTIQLGKDWRSHPSNNIISASFTRLIVLGSVSFKKQAWSSFFLAISIKLTILYYWHAGNQMLLICNTSKIWLINAATNSQLTVAYYIQ